MASQLTTKDRKGKETKNMKFLIMAAGRGTRISRHIQDKPKCCIEFEGEALIKRTIRVLKNLNLGEVGIVLGYKSDEVLKIIDDLNIKAFYNPFFDVTNSIASLWFAREFISTKEDLVILNGDLYLETNLVEHLMEAKKFPVLLSDSSRIEEADYRFVWQGDILERFGKEIPNHETTGEYVGIGRIGEENISSFVARMHEMINSQQSGKWWEDVLFSFVGPEMNIFIKDIKGAFWAELDYIEDFHRVESYLKDKQR
jgi:choline kinase